MSQIAATQITKPRDEQAFERACLILFRELLGDPNVKTNGRRGQRQNGVDIIGIRDQDAAHPVGIQCKLKGEGKELSEKEVRDEVEKALTFVPALREFIIVTTAPDDSKIDRVARELTVEKGESSHGQIAISVWGWNTLEQRISEHGPAMQAFDPSYGPFAKQQVEEIHRVGDQQAVLIREVGKIRQEIGILSGSGLPGGNTVVQDVLEGALDAEVDRYRDILNAGKPKTALGLYQALLAKVQSTASGRILFRIKANIGHCYFVLDDNERAVHWLLEGFSHAPNEPKAIANKALSMLLSGKFRDAYDYGISELERDPSNQFVAPMVIQAAARCTETEDPLPAIPEPLRGLQDVQTTYVDFLRLRNRTPDWWVSARAASKVHPDHKPLLQYKAEADLDEIEHSEFKRDRRLSAESRNKIAAAADVLAEIWNTRKVSENPARPDGVVACCNLLAAYQAVGRRIEAIAVAKEAISLVPNDEPLSERAAIAALEVDDYAFAEQLLPKLPTSANAILIRFQFYAHTANWAKLIEIAQKSDGAPEHEQPSIRTMGRLASLMVGAHSKDQQHEVLESIFNSAGNDLRSNILVSDFARRLDFKDLSERAYSEAVKIAEKQESVFGRQMLARSAGQREDWSEVIKLLDGHFDGTTNSDELSLIATAFVNENPTRKRAIEFFKELDQSVRDLPFYLVAFSLLQSKRGDLPTAVRAFEQALTAEPENLTALRNLYSVYVRQGRSDRDALISKYVESLNFKKLKGSALDKMALAHILRDIGQDQRALELAYEVIGQNRNDPDVALGYFGLIIGRGDEIKIPQPDKVGLNTWVSLQNNLGEKQQFVIEKGTDRPADGIYTPEHPFVAPALGLKVGDSFSQARQIGKPDLWTILEIKSKYLSALHEVMETFNVRFPEARGFYRVTTQSGDISPILDEVKSHSEKSQAIADLYLEKKIPLSFVAALAHTETIKFASGIAQFGRDISACYGNVPERTAAEDLARAYANKGAVFDSYTAWTAEAIGVLPALQELFGKLSIPRSAIDELATIQHDLTEYPGPLMTVSYRDGQYFREELTAAQNEERAKAFAKRRQNIEQVCEVLPVDIPDDASDLTRGLIAQVDRHHILDAALLAAENDRLLLSDDMYYRQVAKQTCAAKGIYLQAAISVAVEKGILDNSNLAKAIVGLASLRHSHVALSPAILLQVAKDDETERQIKFRAVTEFIGTTSAEIYSHVDVTILFLRQVWNLDIPDIIKMACSGIIIEQLLRFRTKDLTNIILKMRSELSGNARTYLEAWIKGHFLNLDAMSIDEPINTRRASRSKRRS